MTSIPVLHVYDHCPFCTRARMALGFKRAPYVLNVLANDDVATPTSLIGRKLVPILQPGGVNDARGARAESLDIVKLIDSDSRYGPVHTILPKSPRTDLDNWAATVMPLAMQLCFPRFSRARLPEFPTQASRHAFEMRHPLGYYDYEQCLRRTHQFGAELGFRLCQLESMIFSEQFVTEGGFSIDDILLYPVLRMLTVVKDIEFPPKVRAYIQSIASQTQVPTHEDVAI